ncbi:hypothetical protein M876_06690 [Elizabethkingia anophelis FMS-007]|nr:hypothetical protein M876_06690 [Elizabethkingia anophelis FMS-007]EQB93921.1 hypothetical protein C874_04060 [Elizabethkingia anophelis 502]
MKMSCVELSIDLTTKEAKALQMVIPYTIFPNIKGQFKF